MEKTSSSPFFNHTVRANTIDLTTQPINSESQGCLVDRKLVDLFVKQVIHIPFEQAKEVILNHISTATNFGELTQMFNDSTYVHTVCQIIIQKDEENAEEKSKTVAK